MKAFWDDRYSNPEFVYGELPNEFLKARLPNFSRAVFCFQQKEKAAMPCLPPS
jgi:hypothetical protein